MGYAGDPVRARLILLGDEVGRASHALRKVRKCPLRQGMRRLARSQCLDGILDGLQSRQSAPL